LAAPQRNLRRGTHQGAAGLSPRSLARRNTLDEMTVARTEVPLGGPRPAKPMRPRPGDDRPQIYRRGVLRGPGRRPPAQGAATKERPPGR